MLLFNQGQRSANQIASLAVRLANQNCLAKLTTPHSALLEMQHSDWVFAVVRGYMKPAATALGILHSCVIHGGGGVRQNVNCVFFCLRIRFRES
ncbi:hypothetical protein FKM82_025196 [Ascaphus truei]